MERAAQRRSDALGQCGFAMEIEIFQGRIVRKLSGTALFEREHLARDGRRRNGPDLVSLQKHQEMRLADGMHVVDAVRHLACQPRRIDQVQDFTGEALLETFSSCRHAVASTCGVDCTGAREKIRNLGTHLADAVTGLAIAAERHMVVCPDRLQVDHQHACRAAPLEARDGSM